MAWDDIVFGVLTGGLYNVGKAAYQAGDAAEEAGDAAEQAGAAIAVIGSTIESVGKQLESLLKETEELITIKRLTPRDESDLWEEEKERLDALRQKKTQLESELAALGVSQPGEFTFDIWDFLSDPSKVMKKLQLISSLVIINSEIHEILYQEPGVVTTAIYNASEVLERFNTIEQPKIEDILDSVDDNLQVSEEVLEEIKKLFVIKKKVPYLEAELSEASRDMLKVLDLDTKYYKGLMANKSLISNQLISAIDKIPATKFEISEKGIKVAGLKKTLDVNPAANINLSNPGNANVGIRGQPPWKPDPEVKPVLNEKAISRDVMASDKVIPRRDLETINRLSLALASRSKSTPARIQPQGAKISAVLNTKLDGYQRIYASQRARTIFYDRELFKIGRKIEKIKFRWEDEPGVIPETLEELKKILERVRAEEQPRVETVLDTLNENLEESKETLSKVNKSLDSAQGMISFLEKNSNLIKIGLGVVGAVVFLDLLLVLIVLLRMVLGV